MKLLLWISALAAVAIAAAPETLVRTEVDEAAGELRIVTSTGRVIKPVKQPEQVGFAQTALAPDKRSAGWVGLFPGGSTSYPIPMALHVMTAGGEIHTFTGNGLPVWRWLFQRGGRQVAFKQETLHGGMGVHYELREVSSGRLLAKYDPLPSDAPPDMPAPKKPAWAAVLDLPK